MTFDLFGQASSLERLDIPDAEIWFARSIELPEQPQLLCDQLIRNTPWRHEAVMIYGKKVMQPRLIAWYGDAGNIYSYSGISLQPLAWTNLLLTIKGLVEDFAGEIFNSVLLNYYRDHRDSMGFHSDDEKELGPNPAIASLSLGQERTFVLKHKMRVELKPIRIDLTSGSLLVMKGPTQGLWKHGIDKLTKPCGPRVNLTFRKILAR